MQLLRPLSQRGYPAAVDAALSTPIIVCPLAFEEQTLRKSKVLGRFVCSGPGEAGMARLGGLIGGGVAGPVVLAGVAGGLDPAVSVGSAWLAREVIGMDGREWIPSWPEESRRAQHMLATITGSDVVLASAAEKTRFAKALGKNRAQLVDQESEHFAKLAEERGWRWGVVRGVSDGLETSLPPGIATWVDERGRTKRSRVLRECARDPAQIRSLMTLRRNTVHALHSVAALLQEMLR